MFYNFHIFRPSHQRVCRTCSFKQWSDLYWILQTCISQRQDVFLLADLVFKSLNVFVVSCLAFIGFSRPKELFSWAAFPIALKVKAQLWSLFKLDIYPRISFIFVCISGPDKREENGKGIFGRNGRLMEDGWLGIDYIQNNMLLHKKYRTGQKL